ncbi:MAG: N-acetylmuramoyl-L-alanine amidase [Candidatus Nanopelagicaceae bacterium]
MIEVLLRPGDSGDLVDQVIASLNRIGLLHSTPELYDQSVAAAVAQFQQERGLTSTGNVNNQTFQALEEARWKLGDRSLYLTAVLMRGDDVAQLQSRLTDMGFDCGRVDGIFGEKTELAVKEFQKSVGSTVDGKCGPATITALIRLTKTVAGGAPTKLRETARQQSRGPALAGKVIVINPARGGDNHGVSANGAIEAEITYDIATRVEGRLLALGASVFLTRGPHNDPTENERIQLTNSANADLMISLNFDSYRNESAHGVATYSYGSDTHGVHSVVGDRFASLVQREICARTDLQNCGTHSKTWDLLRLVQAPAVRIDLGYLTNPQDADRYTRAEFRDLIAESLVIAIQRLYLAAEDDAKTGTLRISDLKRAGLRIN